MNKAARRRAKKELESQKITEAIANFENCSKNSDKSKESDSISKNLINRGLVVFEIPPDGDCMFSAIAHQLNSNGYVLKNSILSKTGSNCVASAKNPELVTYLRKKTANNMRNNIEEYMPFAVSRTTEEVISQDDYMKHCESIESTSEWGSHLELRALSNEIEFPITVVQSDGPEVDIGGDYEKTRLVITFHKNAFTQGGHYNSTITVA